MLNNIAGVLIVVGARGSAYLASNSCFWTAMTAGYMIHAVFWTKLKGWW